MVLACPCLPPPPLHTLILKSVPSLPWKMPFELGIMNRAGGGLEEVA